MGILDYTHPYAPVGGHTGPAPPVTATSANSPVSGIGVGNPYGPIGADPGLQAAIANRNRARANADAQLRQLRSQALVNFGDPSLLAQFGIAADPNAAAAAAANKFSVVAGLKQRDQLTRQAMVNNLAARGILASGDYGYGQQQAAQAYGTDLYQAEQAILQALAGYQQSYLDTTNAADSSFADAVGAAQARYNQNPDPGIYGNWTTPSAKAGAQTQFQYVPSPYFDPVNVQSKITEYLK